MLTPAKAGHPDTGESCICDSAGSHALSLSEFMLHAKKTFFRDCSLSRRKHLQKKKNDLRNAAESGHFIDRFLLL